MNNLISIHALLAESDHLVGELVDRVLTISIHALLAESDSSLWPHSTRSWSISIHALLAESDGIGAAAGALTGDFYPRSPCGERRRPNLALRVIL